MEKKVPEVVKVKKVAIPGLTAKLIKTDNNVAIYLREDGYYEVGICKFNPKEYIYPDGYILPAGKFIYWSNEDFGSIASATGYHDREKAEEFYEMYQSIFAGMDAAQ